MIPADPKKITRGTLLVFTLVHSDGTKSEETYLVLKRIDRTQFRALDIQAQKKTVINVWSQANHGGADGTYPWQMQFPETRVLGKKVL